MIQVNTLLEPFSICQDKLQEAMAAGSCEDDCHALPVTLPPPQEATAHSGATCSPVVFQCFKVSERG